MRSPSALTTLMSCNEARSFLVQAAKGRTPKRPISTVLHYQQKRNSQRQTLYRSQHLPTMMYPSQPRELSSSTSAAASNKHVGGKILAASDTGTNGNKNTNRDKLPIGLKQLFDEESSTYTYLLWDEETKDALLVDPVDTQVERDMKEIQSLGLNLVYAINTHAHADHITGTWLLKQAMPGLESVISQSSGAASDKSVSHGDKIVFGKHHLEVRATPGHTEGCVSLVSGDESFVLTGDTLLIQGCGRTDFQGGSSETLYASVKQQLFSLPDTTVVYPAHDYKGRTQSTIGTEKETNPRLGGDKSMKDFVEIMNQLNLPYPKKLDVAVPANMRCGVQDDDGL